MAGSRTLKLSILADVDDLRKKLSEGGNEVESFGGKLGDFGKKAGAAFAVATAAAAVYAGKLLIDGVKSAIEDEKAQAALATTLQNVAGASKEVIKNTEDYITRTALAVGVTDDQLRPSLDRLVRSTKDVEQAQKLQALALDISAGSGKSLDTVTQALARGFEGNTTALGKLGLGLDAAQLKSMTFDEITKALSDTFNNQANIAADTFSGKMTRLGIAFDEAKETVGSFVLDAITPLLTNLVDVGIPAIGKFADDLGQKLGPIVTQLFNIFKNDLLPILIQWWEYLYNTVIPGIIKTVTPVINGLVSIFNKVKQAITDNYDQLEPLIKGFKSFVDFVVKNVIPILGAGLGKGLEAIGSIIAGLITGFSKVAGAIESVISAVRSLINLVASNPLVKGISNLISGAFGGGKASGGAVSAGTSYIVGEKGAELFTPKSDGFITPNNQLGGSSTTNISINVNGALDKEGVARQIIDLLNNSYYRGTLSSGVLKV
jgi:hypothetical protein